VLCTDLVGSTALLGRLGEEEFDTFRRRHFALLRAALARHDGSEIKTLGDGILAVFTSAADAVSCAVALQQAVDHPAGPELFAVAIRIGLAVGDVSHEDGDVFGTPVVQAARLTAAARGGQILTTELVRAVAGGRSLARCVDLGPMQLKGLPEPVGVCEVRWERAAAVGAVELRLLGPVDVVVDGRAIGIGSGKQRVVLAVLASAPRTVVGADALVDALWGERPPASAHGTLRSLVARLRRTLDEAGIADTVRLFGKDSGYVLDVDPIVVDVHRFDALCTSAAAARQRGDHGSAVADLETALALWHGPALGEPTGAECLTVEARRLEEARRLADEDLAAAALESGRTEFALAKASALVASHPMRERAWGLVMLAAYRAGRQAEALEAYHRLRRVLADELGIEPTPALRELHERILRQDPALAPASAVPEVPRANVTVRHNIPLALTSFVGRSTELAALGPLVADARMVTLTGVGGAGKTRLALTWAAQTAAAYPDGVRVAELAPIREPALIPAAVAGAIGFLPGELTSGGLPLADALCAQLRERRMLVVLDNCEHLVAAVAELCMAMLSRCPEVTVLATSRELLGVPGELVYPVPPLSLPTRGTAAAEIGSSDAGRLFCERARAADPGFTLTAANSAAVLEICRRLDGIPLALELAAARMRVLSPAQVADRLSERLVLLGAAGRGTVPRHQTLRAAIDWSYDLLPPAEQALLSRLSVFPGTFDLAAAEAVTAAGDAASDPRFDSLDLLTRLVDKSLVTVTRDGADTRFGLLETVREYAAEKLVESGELDRVRKCHRDHYLGPAGTSTRKLDTFAGRLRTVGRELDNYRAALRWSVEHEDGAAVLALAIFAGPHWLIVANDDEGWLEHAFAVPVDLDLSAAAEVRCLQAMFNRDRGGSARRYSALQEESLRLAGACGDLDTVGRVSAWFSELELGAGNQDRAEELREAAGTAFQSPDDRLGQAWCEHQLALIRLAADDIAEEDVTYDLVYREVFAFYELTSSFMSSEVFSLADRFMVRTYADLIWQMCDPRNRMKTYHMPPTRDMSAAKARLLLRFLRACGAVESVPTFVATAGPARKAITTRGELVRALRDAATIELAVMLQYLYAAFSIPTHGAGSEHVRRGLWSPRQLALACGDGGQTRDGGMRGSLLTVAREEMIHFLVVNNIITAIGEPFHVPLIDFGAINHQLPIPLDLSLEPLSVGSVTKFIAIEQPIRLVEEVDRRGSAPPESDVDERYRSVSELYADIREGLRRVPDLFMVGKGRGGGEHHLFLRRSVNDVHPDYQLEVDDLASALFAVDVVTEQGEGNVLPSIGPATGETSHFDTFLRMYTCLTAAQLTGPPERAAPWTPAYPALRNPTLLAGDAAKELVTDPAAAEVMRLFNRAYFMALELMVQHFGESPDASLRRSGLMNRAIDVMTGVMRPLGELLTTLPSGRRGATAGPSFELESVPGHLSRPDVARRAISLRFRHLAAAARTCSLVPVDVTETLDFLADFFSPHTTNGE